MGGKFTVVKADSRGVQCSCLPGTVYFNTLQEAEMAAAQLAREMGPDEYAEVYEGGFYIMRRYRGKGWGVR